MTGEQINDTAAITHRGPVAGVQVHAHMEFGPYALSVPLDTKVVIQLMFMLAEQTRQGPDAGPLRVTPLTVLERLRELGVVSGNGSRLVGRDAVYESFARLQEKGYIRRLEERGPDGRRVRIAYDFYDWPSWNPDAPKHAGLTDFSAFPQVSSTSGIAGSGNAGSENAQKGANSRSAQVSSTSGIAGSGNAGSGNAETAFPQVSSTSGNAGSPPHPPEEEDSSSSNLLTGPSGVLPSQREEAKPAEEEIAAAVDFLQQMNQWQPGASTARRAAPRLVRTMREQGWPRFAELDQAQRVLLEEDILKNTGGAVSWPKCLPGWVADLRRYRKPAAATASADAGPDRRSIAALRAACPACDQYGWVDDPTLSDDAPPVRCTHPSISADDAKEAQQ